MEINKIEKQSVAIKFIAKEKSKEIGRAFLYLIYNDLHTEPYGLLEDVFVDEASRGKGIGNTLVLAVIHEAKKRGCYKLIATSRESRHAIHTWYERLGFKNYGLEFRMDL
ncbi:GNAT family N-acetyltransferase [Candidatus Uhrbacteria bacterium]|nr:GNAT family N-acetyltransferase [Candidatus Uhrbacteria bacterium]